jgi:hypothetical protein
MIHPAIKVDLSTVKHLPEGKPPFSLGFPRIFPFSYGFPMIFLWFSYAIHAPFGSPFGWALPAFPLTKHACGCAKKGTADCGTSQAHPTRNSMGDLQDPIHGGTLTYHMFGHILLGISPEI